MKPTVSAKWIFLLLLTNAQLCYGANPTKISYSTTDFYILKNQPFTTISCSIDLDEATKYLESIEEKPEELQISYSVEENLSNYSFTLHHDGIIEFSPTALQIHLDENALHSTTDEKVSTTAWAWKKGIEAGYQNLIRFSSQLVKDSFKTLVPESPEGEIVSTRIKKDTLTFVYGSLFSKTTLNYKLSEKGYLLISSSSNLANFREKLSSDAFVFEYQTIDNLIIPKKISRTLYINRSINGKKNSEQEMVVTLKNCQVKN